MGRVRAECQRELELASPSGEGGTTVMVWPSASSSASEVGGLEVGGLSFNRGV
jgi:hypothetical protein